MATNLETKLETALQNDKKLYDAEVLRNKYEEKFAALGVKSPLKAAEEKAAAQAIEIAELKKKLNPE